MPRHHAFAFVAFAFLSLSACGEEKQTHWSGTVGGEHIYIAPAESGELAALSAEKGTRVKSSDLLFQLEAQKEKADFAAATEALTQAKEALKKAEHELTSQSEQKAQNLIARAVLDMARARRDRAGNAMLAATSARDQAEWKLKRREGHAPSDALIHDISAQTGDFVTPGSWLVSLLPLQNLRIIVSLQEDDISGFEPGSIVAISCDACPDTLTGTIESISAKSEAQEKLAYHASITPAHIPDSWTPESSVTISFIASEDGDETTEE